MIAVQNNGKALNYTPKELQNDREIVMAAIKNDGEALRYASKELQNDREILMDANNIYIYLIYYKNFYNKLIIYLIN
jgi:uncharacterized membrane protein YqjE